MNLVSYVKRNSKTFKEAPFNDVDALVLSWLSYFTFPDYLKGEKVCALSEFLSLPLLSDKLTYAKTFNPRTSKKLFKLLMKSPRFSGVEIFDFSEETDEEEEKQFASFSANIDDKTCFVGFRGTDFSFVGLKEDLNLAYDYPVPAQTSALSYLEKQMTKSPDKNFIVGGHSKGGNLAFYSAMELPAVLQERVIKAYNFDGPGFIKDVYGEDCYKRVEDRLFKIIPDSSFIGMLLETKENFEIIKSRTISFL